MPDCSCCGKGCSTCNRLGCPGQPGQVEDCVAQPASWQIVNPGGFTDGSFTCSQWNANWTLCYSPLVPCYTDNGNDGAQICWSRCGANDSIFVGNLLSHYTRVCPSSDFGGWTLLFCNNTCQSGSLCCAEYVACFVPQTGFNDNGICDSPSWTYTFNRYWDPINKQQCSTFCGSVPPTITVARSNPLQGCGLCGEEALCNSGPQDADSISTRLTATITASNTPSLLHVGDTILLNWRIASENCCNSGLPCYFFGNNYWDWSGYYTNLSGTTVFMVLSYHKAVLGIGGVDMLLFFCQGTGCAADRQLMSGTVGATCDPLQATFSFDSGQIPVCGHTGVTATLSVIES